MKLSEQVAKQAAERQAAEMQGKAKQAADPAPDKDDEWKSGAQGYCQDCQYMTGQAPGTSYLCNGCTKARICNACEFKFQLCWDCREAHVSCRVPGADGNGNN
eukprot:15147105-Ditylum_brightwellii.AAC.1